MYNYEKASGSVRERGRRREIVIKLMGLSKKMPF
jgi:hypothetical protein